MPQETVNTRMPVDDEQVVELSTVMKHAIEDAETELQETKALSPTTKNTLRGYLPELKSLLREKKDEGYYAKVDRLLKDAD